MDAALTGIAEPDRWISYARANSWWSRTEDVTKAAQDMAPGELTDELERVRTELIGIMTPDELEAEHARISAELRLIEATQPDKAGDSLH